MTKPKSDKRGSSSPVGKEELKDDSAEFQLLVDSLNADKVKLLLLVWNILGDGNKDATVLDIDKMGFKFELTNSKGDSRVERYEFDADEKSPLGDLASVRKEVAALQSKSRVAVLPINPGVFISLLLWLLLMCGTSQTDGIGSRYAQGMKALAHSVLQSPSNCVTGLYILLASHVVECIYAWSLMTQMELDTFCKVSWSALIVVFGFPVTSQVRFLHGYWKRQEKSNTKKEK